MGRRTISLEPPTSILGFLGLTVMEVSLCGVSSLLTSTLVPTVREPLGEVPGEVGCFSSCWYLAHHVGWL